ncbi:MAG: hypothetical protein JSW06_08505 [Thermoplasmatales archaeon]|nr:MAG: hypothetical protein JSW06_08505 [Thermoplasmatales archaeon]
MKKNENIHVKLQIGKDVSSGKLTLNVYFDKDTPNFFTDKNVLSWCPTIEEIDFVNEAFEMVSKSKNYKHEKKVKKDKGDAPVVKKTEDHLKASKEEKTVESEPDRLDEDTEESSNLSDSEKKEVDEWFV